MGDVLKCEECPGTGFPEENENTRSYSEAQKDFQEYVFILQGKPGEPEGYESKEDNDCQKRGAGIAEVNNKKIGKAENSIEDFYKPFLRHNHINAEAEHGCCDHPGGIGMEAQHELRFRCHACLLAGRKCEDLQMENMPEAIDGEDRIEDNNNMHENFDQLF